MGLSYGDKYRRTKAAVAARRAGAAALSALMVAGLVPLQVLAETDGEAAPAVHQEAATGTFGAGAAEILEDETGGSDFSDVELAPGSYVEGEVLVAFADGTMAVQAEGSLSALSVEEPELMVDDESLEQGDLMLVDLPEEVTVSEALETLSDDPRVAYAQPNYIYTLVDGMDAEYYEVADDGSATPIPVEEVTASYEAAAKAAGVDDPDPASGTQSSAAAAQDAAATAAPGDQQASFVPNDPWISQRPGADHYQYCLTNMNVFPAWDTVRTERDEAVRVAVIDTGVFVDHTEFTGEATGLGPIIATEYAYDATRGGANQANDTFGHGTHVSGIISAEANNRLGIAGISYNAQVVPIKVFPDYQGTTTSFYIVSGFRHVLEVPGVRVVNMSLGGYGGYAESDDRAMRAALAEMNEKGIVVVCASGNDNTTAFNYPGDYDECMSVNATTKSDEKADYSNYGPRKDISAPGSEIMSTYIDVAGYTHGQVMAVMSGTSMASPNAAGVAALVIKKHPEATADQVKNVLYNTARDVGDPGFDNTFANGIIDAGLAVAQDPTIMLTAPSSVLGQTNTMQMQVEGQSNYDYEWSLTYIEGEEGNAAISQTGLLLGINPCKVRVRAALRSDPSRYAEKNIAITPLRLANAPTVASVSSSSLRVSWEEVEGALGYIVLRTADPDDESKWERIATVESGTHELLDEGLTCGDLWYYAIIPFTEFNGVELMGERSATASARVAPSQPQNLQVASTSYTGLEVSWDTVDQADGYYVYRRMQDLESEFSLVDDVVQPAGDPVPARVTYSDEGLETGMFYEYKVCAYKLFGYREVTSVESDTASGCPNGEGYIVRGRAPLDFVQNTAEAADTSVMLTWTPEEGVDGYLLEVAELGRDSSDPVRIEGGSTRAYRIEGLEPASIYHCSMRSYSTEGGVDYPSGDRAQATVATKPPKATGFSTSQTRNGAASIGLSWDEPAAGSSSGTVLEQRGRAYGNSDGVLIYRGQWVPLTVIARTADNECTARLSDEAPTLQYGISEFRARHYLRVSATDRSGTAVELAGEQSLVYGDYSDPAAGLGSMRTPDLRTVELSGDDKTDVTLAFTAPARVQRVVVYRATSRSGPFEEIARVQSPYYDAGLGQTGATSFTDTGIGESGLYWYYLIGESDVGDGVWTSDRSSVKSVRVTVATPDPDPIDISGAAVAEVGEQAYTGSSVEPKPAVTYGGQALVEGTDYTVSYANNVEPGTATVTITGIGAYTGTKEARFTIAEPPAPPEPVQASWKRLAGSDRYGTMAAVVGEAYADGSCATVIVASGKNFPDALAASSLAGVYDAPIVLTAPGALTPAAAKQIERLGAKRAIVVGGTAAVSADVAKQIEAKGVKVTRIAGASRTETAAKVATAAAKAAPSKTVIVASGKNFPDALSVSPYAYASSTPIVLANGSGRLDAATLAAVREIDPGNVILVGGSAAVSDEVKGQLKGCKVVRLSGSNRYETSAAIARWATGQASDMAVEPAVELSFSNVGIATGANFPDALAGSAMLGRLGGVLLLASQAGAGTFNVKYTIANNNAGIEHGYVLGGTSAVPDSLLAQIEKASKR